VYKQELKLQQFQLAPLALNLITASKQPIVYCTFFASNNCRTCSWSLENMSQNTLYIWWTKLLQKTLVCTWLFWGRNEILSVYLEVLVLSSAVFQHHHLFAVVFNSRKLKSDCGNIYNFPLIKLFWCHYLLLIWVLQTCLPVSPFYCSPSPIACDIARKFHSVSISKSPLWLQRLMKFTVFIMWDNTIRKMLNVTQVFQFTRKESA
jgi:hypothetical protein